MSKSKSDEWRCSECQSVKVGRGYPVCRPCRKDIRVTRAAMMRIVFKPAAQEDEMSKGPLRKIVAPKFPGYIPASVFESHRVWLECGHTTRSWGGVRARCRKCLNPKGG